MGGPMMGQLALSLLLALGLTPCRMRDTPTFMWGHASQRVSLTLSSQQAPFINSVQGLMIQFFPEMSSLAGL